jgi:hypothetical protein
MSNLYAAHNQWMTRPADERYWSLEELLAHSRAERHASHESRTAIEDIRAEAVRVAGYDSPDLRLVAGCGDPLSLTHWSFGQLCAAADAPASYLRRLSANLAATNLNHGLRRMEGRAASSSSSRMPSPGRSGASRGTTPGSGTTT